jgi:uncharacterized protein (UPF0212 family)
MSTSKNKPIAPCMNACPHCSEEFHCIFLSVKCEKVIKFVVDNIVWNISQGDQIAAKLVSLLINDKDVFAKQFMQGQEATKS